MRVKGWINFQRAVLAMQNRIDRFSFTSAVQYRNVVRRTLFELAEASPQWSGRFAASWRVDLGYTRGEGGRFVARNIEAQVDESYGDGGYSAIPANSGETPKFMGHHAAVTRAMTANADTISQISLNTRVTFFNAVPYAEIVMQNEDPYDPDWKLRAGNYHDPTPIPIAYVKSKLGGWV